MHQHHVVRLHTYCTYTCGRFLRLTYHRPFHSCWQRISLSQPRGGTQAAENGSPHLQWYLSELHVGPSLFILLLFLFSVG